MGGQWRAEGGGRCHCGILKMSVCRIRVPDAVRVGLGLPFSSLCRSAVFPYGISQNPSHCGTHSVALADWSVSAD